jgi:hypothetical protein
MGRLTTRLLRPSIAISVGHPTAMVLAHAAVERLGGAPRHVSPVQLTQMLDRPDEFLALIYDLAPWNVSVPPLLTALRLRHPDLPILLYAPNRPEVSEILEQCGDLPVLHLLQQTHDSRDPKALESQVSWLFTAVYGARLYHLIELLLPNPPSSVKRYIRHTLKRFSEGAGGAALTVASLAAEVNVPARTLQHTMEASGLPSPKVFLDWLTLLFAALSANVTGHTIAGIGRDIGVDSHRMYRIRGRLLPQVVGSSASSAAQLFDITFLAFAEACRISRGTANILLEKTA